MGKYRKKPVVIDAVKYNGSNDYEDMTNWLLAAINEEKVHFHSTLSSQHGELTIHILEGMHIASPGDYIIRGIKGELYPCKPDIFEASYEEATYEKVKE